MSRKQEKDFEDLELYLEKAQEELLSSFIADDVNTGIDKGFENRKETENERKSVTETDRDSFRDILDLYDNVDFYAENNNKFDKLEKVDISSIKSCSTDRSYNKKNGRENVENTDCKRFEGQKIKRNNVSVGKKLLAKEDCTSDLKNGTSLDKSDKHTLNLKSNQKSDSVSNPQVLLTCEDVKSRSQGSQVVGKTGSRNLTHDLSDCKSRNVSVTRSVMNGSLSARPSDRKSTSQLCQEVSDHLELSRNQYVSGSQIEVTPENISSYSEDEMQIDSKQPSYLTGDNSQLDNGESDRKREGGTLMSSQHRDVSILRNDGCLGNKLERSSDRNSGNYGRYGTEHDKNGKLMTGLLENGTKEINKSKDIGVTDTQNSKNRTKGNGNCSVINGSHSDTSNLIKDDLEEFLEEINESIDELISEGKSEMCDSCLSSNSKTEISDSVISCSGRSDFSDSVISSKSIMSDSGVSFISRSDISESCASNISSDSGYNNLISSSIDSGQGGESFDTQKIKGSESFVMSNSEIKNCKEEIDNSTRDSDADVVETDAGFYWLTCSIDEGPDTATADCNDKVKPLEDEHERSSVLDEVDIAQDSLKRKSDTKVSQDSLKRKSDTEVPEKPAGDKNRISTLGKVECEIEDLYKTAGNDNKRNSNEVPHKAKYFNDCCKSLERQKESVKNTLLLPGKTVIMTGSSPAALSVGGVKDNNTRENSIIEKTNDIEKGLLKRKYSCPPGMFRIFKVVSVDIPKIDMSKRSGSHESVKRSSLNNLEKRHSKHLKKEKDGKEQKRHSLEALLFKSKEDHVINKQMKEGMDKNGFKGRIEPPAMFRDRPEDDVNSGLILKPPPDFDTNGETVIMDTQHLPPPVWDPGVDVGTSCLHSGDIIHDRKLPSTPPPPPVDHTENLISNTLNQHKYRKHSVDASNGVDFVKPSDPVRRKSADSGMRSEYVDLDMFQKSCSKTLNLIKDNKIEKTDATEIETESQKRNSRLGLEQNDTKLSNITGSVEVVNTSEYQEVLPRTDTSNDQSAVELAKMLDLIESYQAEEKGDSELNSSSSVLSDRENMCHKQEMSYDDSKTADILDRRKAENTEVKSTGEYNVKDDEEDSSAIYATVDKYRPRLPTPEKVVPETFPQDPPPIPPKPKYLSEAFKCNNSFTDIRRESSPDLQVKSPDLQVMFNSLSPVLLRRSNSSRSHRKQGSSTETSPESTPDVSPRGAQTAQVDFRKNQSKTGKNGPSESLFMDPEMAKTWHGTTSTDWCQYYGPQMRAMMKKLDQVQNGEVTSSQDSVAKSTESLEDSRSKTLPSKSLLDEMHKKFCADQYINGKDIEMTRALVLFRLKSQQPPSKSRRSQSFNIRMGTGAPYSRLKGLKSSNSSMSSDSSLRFPRSSERLRIKTRPDVQYSPKPVRARGVTPEPLKLEDANSQAQNSLKEEAEIEAIEACRWLRETGFPQYAQLYEDGQFPLDLQSVEKDHDFLDKEDIQSLFRRLNTLNKCAIMKIATPTKKECEDSDEEDICALSDKWKYQRTSRRWSRKDLDCPVIENRNGQQSLRSASSHDSLLADQNSSSETGDSPVLDSKMLHTGEDAVFKTSTPTYDTNGNATTGVSPKMIRRAASDRMKGAKSFLKRMESLKGKRSRKNKTITEISGPVVADNADMQAKIKHLNCRDINLRVDANSNIPEANESLVNGEPEADVNVAITSPELITSPRNEALTVATPQRRGENFNALNMSNSSVLNSDIGNASLEKSSDLSNFSTNGALGLDFSARSRHSNSSDATNSSQETVFISGEYRPGKFPTLLDDSLFTSDTNIRTTRSLSYADDNCGKDTKRTRRGSHDPRKQMNRVSIYDNVPIEEDLTTAQQELDIILSELFQNINGLNKAINGENAELFEPPVSEIFVDDSSVSIDSQNADIEGNLDVTSDITQPDENEVISGTLSSPDISDHEAQTEDMSHDDSAEHIVVRERRDSGVGSSLTRTNSERRKYRIRWHSFQKSHRPTSESRNLQLYNLSAGQILRLRKLSLLKLTALIEKYAPNRSGWSLTVPRFMKRNKVPDYKDKNVFGVPFFVMIQRTGQALPQCILHAMRFLRRTAGDALGIFRKSGVRSRIQKLRNDIEADPEAVNFEDLQAYDVADLVKQYFRELPECLLTTKLSDIFISIFIYVPTELRLEALQAAVVLMTDENRDVLQSLLLFLSDIAKQANKHQMTASNLAVCFAPSLFNMGSARNVSQTPSPRRNRKSPGIPDARELMEQKAAHECLTVMINECKKLFTIPAATLSKCRVFDEDPVTLEDLNKQTEDSSQGYNAHIESCIQGLLKESREKFRGWVSVSSPSDVDVSYKKVGDGHPLRLWKCTVDVEAPPNEVLNRVLNDRQKWDEDLLQWNTVEKLDEQTEVFQYVRNSMAPHPTRDYCVLRSWRADLPKGACVLISTSIDHKDADLLGGIRAVELASRYLIEPCGTGKSRLTHISRVDLRGHSPEWYKKVYGHICAILMDHIRASFHCNSDGPETKV